MCTTHHERGPRRVRPERGSPSPEPGPEHGPDTASGSAALRPEADTQGKRARGMGRARSEAAHEKMIREQFRHLPVAAAESVGAAGMRLCQALALERKGRGKNGAAVFTGKVLLQWRAFSDRNNVVHSNLPSHIISNIMSAMIFPKANGAS